MTTTIVRDSIVGDAWIQQMTQLAPVQRVLNEQGQPTQDILTGLVRLSWCDGLFDLPQPTAQNANPKYGTSILFPPEPYVDFSLFYEDYYKVCASSFAEYYDAQSQQYYGLHSPFRQQAEKLKFGGYTPGGIFMTVSTKFKPSVVDSRGNPIVDKSKVYAGVWAICSVNAYPNTDNRTRGVRFGLQNVMIIGDDKPLSGGGADPSQTFKGIAGKVAAPITRPELGAVRPGPNGAAPAPSGPPVPQTRVAAPGAPSPSVMPPVPSAPMGAEESEDDRLMREMMGG